MQLFFDTSALVKLYHRENGTDAVLQLYGSTSSIVISELGKVEFLSAIHKKLRNGEIAADVLEAVRDRFDEDCAERFVVIPVASLIVDTALEIIGSHGKLHHLFSLDALQVATFSVIDDGDTTFVCADKRLAALMETMGRSIVCVQ